MTLTFCPEQSSALSERLLFFHCATFRCPSKPQPCRPLGSSLGASVQLAGEGSYCEQRGDSGGGLYTGRIFFPGGIFVRVMERIKFNFVAMSLGHCMINSDSNARGYREGKCQHISNTV